MLNFIFGFLTASVIACALFVYVKISGAEFKEGQ